MKNNHKEILEILANYMELNSELRFGQVLYNLGITEFADINNPDKKGYLLRDIYNDSDDKILKKIKVTAFKNI